MARGSLIVEVTYSEQALPVGGVQVHIFSEEEGYDATFYTNEEGKTPEVVLQAPSIQYSLQDSGQKPYSTYNVEVMQDGIVMNRISGIQIFGNITSLQQISLNPIVSFSVEGNTVNIPEHSLYSGDGGSGRPEPVEDVMQFVLAYPIIPSRMRVHLGRPGTNGRIVTVTFADYIKNVASSEIYPTWPENAIRANVYCQISLAMNRIYTEWYPSKGYNFDITNSTTVDQAFVYGRDIFENISRIVDELFTSYIRKINTINPFYAEYCDGRTAQCPGLKQWGTVTYANQGLNPFEILKRYYSDIEIVTTNRIEENVGSYPGYALKLGMRDSSISIIQNQLNRISVNYPNIKPIIPVDGIFTTQLEESVKIFQRQFNLTADGIVGRATWFKISYIYVAVKKLAELKSEGEQVGGNGQFPGVILREGSTGVNVQQLQYYLNTVADFTPLVDNIRIDGNFGRTTRAAVVNFQKLARLTPDGIVGEQTWNTLVQAYEDTQEVETPDIPPVVPFPGTILRLGSQGEDVRSVQYYMNRIFLGSSAIAQITIDGIYGPATEEAVRTFQREQNLTPDGVVGKETWDRMISVYNTIITNAITSRQEYQLYDFTTDNSIDLMYNI